MCTVSYIPNKKGFIFTSNRDEQVFRKTIVPANYKDEGVSLFYPKDEVAGGTWIGVSEYKRLVCLLNGGFVYHDPTIKFPKSRGVVVKSILTSKNLLETLNTINLEGVAPFTLIVVDWCGDLKVYELVWCKKVKKVSSLDANEPFIWSSSTLYTKEMKNERRNWFDKEVISNDGSIKENILNFHQNEKLGCKETAPKMKRDVVETISTTMVVKENSELSMEYHDYTNEEVFRYNNIFATVSV